MDALRRPVGAAFVVEWLLSFILMFVIVAVATDERVADGFAGIAVGLTVGFNAMTGGPLTGASMNPARSLGPAVAGGIWAAHWIYWVAPISAMMVAARVYDALRPAQAAAVVPGGIAVGVEGPITTHSVGRTVEADDLLAHRGDLEAANSPP